MRIERLNSNWESVYGAILDAYMEYDRSGPPESAQTTTATHDAIYCVDLFGECCVSQF